MINKNEDITPIEYIIKIIQRESWVDEELLISYELCYRYLRKVAIDMNLDTSELDKRHDYVMGLYER